MRCRQEPARERLPQGIYLRPAGNAQRNNGLRRLGQRAIPFAGLVAARFDFPSYPVAARGILLPGRNSELRPIQRPQCRVLLGIREIVNIVASLNLAMISGLSASNSLHVAIIMTFVVTNAQRNRC